MSNPVINIRPEHSARGLVISEVRAELARKNISASALARITGTKQQFWSRRLTGITPFDVDDFATLSAVLQVPMSRFMPDFTPGGPENEKGPESGVSGPSLPDLDSNQEPAGITPAPIPLVPRRSTKPTPIRPGIITPMHRDRPTTRRDVS